MSLHSTMAGHKVLKAPFCGIACTRNTLGLQCDRTGTCQHIDVAHTRILQILTLDRQAQHHLPMPPSLFRATTLYHYTTCKFTVSTFSSHQATRHLQGTSPDTFHSGHRGDTFHVAISGPVNKQVYNHSMRKAV